MREFITQQRGIVDYEKKTSCTCTFCNNSPYWITVKANVTSIGKEAFKNCKKLKTLTINSKKLKSVGKNALKGVYPKAVVKVKTKKIKKLFAKKGQGKKVKIRR